MHDSVYTVCFDYSKAIGCKNVQLGTFDLPIGIINYLV